MLPTTHNLVHQLIEQTVHVGDTTIDGTTANGINTRFLATRVGPSGRVLSYTATKDNANAAAASLFMSGLSERVTLLGKTIDRQFVTELGPQSQARIAIFDYSQRQSVCSSGHFHHMHFLLNLLCKTSFLLRHLHCIRFNVL